MIFHVFLILTLVDATEKGIMRRHHKALVAEFDGSLESFDSDGERQRQRQQRQRWYLVDKAETPVENHSYQIAFEMDGQLMCWQRETDGCRQFSGDCEVRYCEPQNCDCMIVQIKRCGDHMDLFTEADWDKDPTASGKLSTEYWRGIRVQYYDPSKWGSNATVDVGKALETTLSCMDETGCSCHQSGWFHWSYPQIGGNLVWSPAGNVTDETIGPSGHWGSRLQQSIVVRVYNDAGQASNMYFIPKDVPLSSRSTTTTTAESTTATTTASVAEESTTEEEDEEIEEATTETTETTVTTTTTTMTTTTFTTTTTTVTITTTTVTTTTTSTVTTTTTTEYLAPEYGHAAFQKAKETGMSDDQAAEIAARVAGRAVQRARGSADTWLQLRDSALAASRAAFAAGQAAGMDTAAAAETACLSGGEVAAELKISTGISGKNKVTKAARLVAQRVAGVFRLNREQVEALGQSAEGHASARFAGLEAQKEAQQSGKSWWSVAMAAASAAETDAFTAGKGLNFTAAEVGAHAAGLAAIEVLQALKRPRHKIIKVAGLVARKAGARRGMTSAEAKFAQAMVAQIATVMTDPVLETMFPSTTTTTSTTSTTSTTFTTASTTLLDEEDPTLEE